MNNTQSKDEGKQPSFFIAEYILECERLLGIAANNAHDSGEEDSFEDIINKHLEGPPITAVNSHAALKARVGELEAGLSSVEATAINLHCALQSTAHMDPADNRIPAITGQVVKDLLVLRNQAKALLAPAARAAVAAHNRKHSSP